MDTYKIGQRIEEGILVTIILLNIFVFFELLPGDIEYIKNIISWTTLGYLLFHASLTRIFFGEKNVWADLIIIFSYFMLIVKDMVTIAIVLGEEVHYFQGFYELLAENSGAILEVTFMIGAVVLLLVSLYFTFRTNISSSSLLAILKEDGPTPPGVFRKGKRFFVIFGVLLAFFVVVFNLVMEWLAIAVDAVLLMVGLVIYFSLLVRHKKHLSPESMIFKLGSMGEHFYEHFIESFHEKKKVLYAITGMLVLHLLTDVGNFIVPYIFSFKENILYFSQLGGQHMGIIPLLLQDWASVSTVFDQIGLIGVYLLNIMAISILLVGPAVIWYVLYSEKKFSIQPVLLAASLASFLCLFLSPVFMIAPIDNPTSSLVGVNITTQSPSGMFGLELSLIFLISVVVGVLTLLVIYVEHIKKVFTYCVVIIIELFFGVYIYYFFIDTAKYFVRTIPFLFQEGMLLIGFYIFFFFVINILFYILGSIIFAQETVKSIKDGFLS